MRLPSYDEAQLRFIIANAKDFTTRELSKSLGLTQMAVSRIGVKYGLKFKRPDWSWNKAYAERKKKIKEEQVKVAPPVKKEPMKMQRPAAIYTQIPSPYGISTQMRHL